MNLPQYQMLASYKDTNIVFTKRRGLYEIGIGLSSNMVISMTGDIDLSLKDGSKLSLRTKDFVSMDALYEEVNRKTSEDWGFSYMELMDHLYSDPVICSCGSDDIECPSLMGETQYICRECRKIVRTTMNFSAIE